MGKKFRLTKKIDFESKMVESSLFRKKDTLVFSRGKNVPCRGRYMIQAYQIRYKNVIFTSRNTPHGKEYGCLKTLSLKRAQKTMKNLTNRTPIRSSDR